MRDNSDKPLARAVFVGFVMPAAAICASAPYVASENAAAQNEATRQADRTRLAETISIEWIEMVEDRIAAERLITSERGRGRNRRRAYTLGMSGSGSEMEARLSRILTFYEKVGGLVTMGSLNPNDVARSVRDDACTWRENLTDLSERSARAPSLDQARFEQLQHAITGVVSLCGDAPNAAIASSMWRPMRLIDEAIILEDGQPFLVAVVRNENIVDAPVPALRVGARSDDGAEVGYWLVFPSDPSIPANGEIAIRGRLPISDKGNPAGIKLVSKEGDFAAVRDAERFPNRGRQTWEPWD